MQQDLPADRAPRREPPPPPNPEEPAPGITHEPEPDAENLIPVDDGPGTF